jgi:hypothetical protein
VPFLNFLTYNRNAARRGKSLQLVQLGEIIAPAQSNTAHTLVFFFFRFQIQNCCFAKTGSGQTIEMMNRKEHSRHTRGSARRALGRQWRGTRRPHRQSGGCEHSSACRACTGSRNPARNDALFMKHPCVFVPSLARQMVGFHEKMAQKSGGFPRAPSRR